MILHTKKSLNSYSEMGKNTKKKTAGAAAQASVHDLAPIQQELATLVLEADANPVIRRLFSLTDDSSEVALCAFDALARIAQRLEAMREIIRHEIFFIF
jgi:hypothetical protein